MNNFAEELLKSIRELEKAVSELEVEAAKLQESFGIGVRRTDLRPSPSVTVVSDDISLIGDEVVEGEILD